MSADNTAGGYKIWIIAGVTDVHYGFNGLVSKVQTILKASLFSGQVFVFQRGSGKMVKILRTGHDGLCLFTKRFGWG